MLTTIRGNPSKHLVSNDKENDMEKHLVKNGRRIVGFVYEDVQGQYWFQFGRPSDDGIAFACDDLQHGIACIENYGYVESHAV